MIPAENCAGVMATANNLLYEDDKYFILSLIDIYGSTYYLISSLQHDFYSTIE